MEPDGLRAEAKRFRSAEPSRVIRGFDEDQTRKLLEAAAELLDTAAGRQEAMQRELEQLRSEGGQEAAGMEAIGKALLAATRAGEEIAAEAHVSAERIRTEAETRAAAVLEQATAAAQERERESAARRLELERERTQVLRQAQEEADGILADARQEVEELQRYGEQLRSLVLDSRRRFVELAESALRHLEGVGADGGSQHGDLLDELRPAGGEPSAAPVPGD
ncbi:MAG TPA: DivIVA domain-containing protein [Gaiellaceae bacterium]|nr:DivIVA domain-containing protein [Gaiellaceae bacterium]